MRTLLPQPPTQPNLRGLKFVIKLAAVLLLSQTNSACAEAAKPNTEAGAVEQATPDTGNRVRIHTNMGAIDLELFPAKAPASVDNFLKLVDADFYDGLIFHRVVANFVIQTGGYDRNMAYRDPPRTVVNESANGLLNLKGTVALARLQNPDSADAQFFINVRDNPHLDPNADGPGYSVFGKVVSAWTTVVDIELVDTAIRAGMAAVPITPVIIERVERLP